MKDLGFEYLNALIYLLNLENKKQINKWGIQDHDIHRWHTITVEEAGEVAKAINEYYACYKNVVDIGQSKYIIEVVKESIQSATLYLKIVEMFLLEYCKTKRCCVVDALTEMEKEVYNGVHEGGGSTEAGGISR